MIKVHLIITEAEAAAAAAEAALERVIAPFFQIQLIYNYFLCVAVAKLRAVSGLLFQR